MNSLIGVSERKICSLHQLSASALLKAGTRVGLEPITESGQFRTQQIALTPFLRMSAQFPHPNPPGTKKKKELVQLEDGCFQEDASTHLQPPV